ncbi:MAG: hypothetical protein ACK526_10970 [Planctomyces sp.]|jgi:hypothetical protein
MTTIRGHWVLIIGFLAIHSVQNVTAQTDYDQDPINYSTTTPDDEVAKLAERLDHGDVKLVCDSEHGYLKSLLRELRISESSQVLVFSKTSLQVSRITRKTPRAVYFNDDVYVGWVQRGDVLELSAADAQLGGTFYTLSQKPEDHPLIERKSPNCLQCHSSAHTSHSPGHMVRSVYPDSNGLPVYRLGTHLTNDTSPFEERWGGWYVTGTHGNQRHMGNSWIEDDDVTDRPTTENTQNLTDLNLLLNTSPYLTSHSDLVALMVLGHQTAMHNILTSANHSGRLTARDSLIMNKALERPLEFESESTARRYASAAEKVVRGLLFSGEFPLTDRVAGTTTFAAEFTARGPFDSQGRSLREFDLQKRLFRFPCSFLIYSESFRGLPEGVQKIVWKRLDEILSGKDTSPAFAHLSDDDRKAIREILAETVKRPSFPSADSQAPSAEASLR